jgi:hypothetical protein
MRVPDKPSATIQPNSSITGTVNSSAAAKHNRTETPAAAVSKQSLAKHPAYLQKDSTSMQKALQDDVLPSNLLRIGTKDSAGNSAGQGDHPFVMRAQGIRTDHAIVQQLGSGTGWHNMARVTMHPSWQVRAWRHSMEFAGLITPRMLVGALPHSQFS